MANAAASLSQVEDRVDGVLVSYQPDIELLLRSVESIASQLRHLFLIDNSPGSTIDIALPSNVELVSLGANTGIGHAQNVGIAMSLARGSDCVLLIDQDTLFEPGYVAKALAILRELPDRTAALAPSVHETHQGGTDQGFFFQTWLGFRRIIVPEGEHLIAQASASGLMLRSRHLPAVGLMNEDLFIDWVDFEWCWRARRVGFAVIGTSRLAVRHRLGDRTARVAGHAVNLRGALRHYYIVRNAFHLSLRCPSLGHWQRFVLFIRAWKYVLAYPLLGRPRMQHLVWVCRGLMHALAGRLGRCEAHF